MVPKTLTLIMSLQKRQCGDAFVQTTPHLTTHPPSHASHQTVINYPLQCERSHHAKTEPFHALSHASSQTTTSVQTIRSASGQPLGTTFTAPANTPYAAEDDVYTQNSTSYLTVRIPYPSARNTSGTTTSQYGNPYLRARKLPHTYATFYVT